MYYDLDENQAILIAADFQHLVGKNFSEWTNVPIEKVFALKDMYDNWRVYLTTYTGDKDNPWGLMEHSNLYTTIFHYLTENKIEADFHPDKYGLVQEGQNE